MGHCSETQLWPCFVLCFWGNNSAVLFVSSETATVWVRAKIRRLCFISVWLTCHLKEEIIFFVLHLTDSAASFAAKACCKADQRPPAAELTFWLPRHGSFVQGNTLFCMEECQRCPRPGLRWWRGLACSVGLWCEHQASLLYLARHGLWSSIIPSAFIFWLFFVHLHNLIPHQLCLIA